LTDLEASDQNAEMKEERKRKGPGYFRHLLAVSLVAGIPRGAEATTEDLQNTAQAHPNLIHQWSFDGADVSTAGVDLKGSAHLVERSYGASEPLGYDVSGFDGTSNAFSTSRGPGSDHAIGRFLWAGGANQLPALGNTFSFEIIVQPAQDAITGGSFNLGYILASRVGDDRGYFLVQGDGNLPSPTHPFSSTLGNGYNVPNTNIIGGSPLTVGDWYYVAGSYTADPGVSVTWTNYYANLTAGGPLVTAGPFTNAGGTYPIGTAIDFGIGGRWDNGEAFPGSIDEVNLYNAALDAATFQAHLIQLRGPETLFQITEFSFNESGKPVITWASQPNINYAVDFSLDMTDMSWNELDDSVPGEAGTTSFVHEDFVDGPDTVFYRVRIP